MSVRRPPFKLKVNEVVAVQNPKKTSVRAKKSLKDIFCGTPCISCYIYLIAPHGTLCTYPATFTYLPHMSMFIANRESYFDHSEQTSSARLGPFSKCIVLWAKLHSGLHGSDLQTKETLFLKNLLLLLSS